MKIVLILALLLMPIVSAVTDTTPPTIVSFDFEPKVVDVSQSDQNITFTVQLADDLGGICPGQQARFFSPSERQHGDIAFYGPSVSGDMLNGTYVSNMTLPMHSESGEWHLAYFLLQDNSGNYVNLNEAEMENLGFPTVIEVKA